MNDCATKQDCNLQPKIAVIGGGISGLTAALTLQNLGYYRVVLFEKSSSVGGKINSIDHRGHKYELGALIANHDYKVIMHIAKALNQPCNQILISEVIDHDHHIYDYNSFVKTHFGAWAFFVSATKFFATLSRYPRLAQPGFDGMDPELFVSMSEFARKHHIEFATESIRSFLTGCGYGYYEKVPALYLLKLAPWILKQPFVTMLTFGQVQRWSTFNQGWQSLCQEVAHRLNVRLNAQVLAVHRQQVEDKIKIEVKTHTQTDIFDSIIIATPLDEALEFLDSSYEERNLFSQIEYIRYLVTIIEGERLSTMSFLDHVTPDTIGKINCIVSMHPTENIYQIYQMLDDSMTHDDALVYAQENIAEIGGGISGVIAQKEWKYFPHVSQSQLENGFYRALESQQGKLGTYFVGPLLSFETVEHAAVYAKSLVDKFYPKVQQPVK